MDKEQQMRAMISEFRESGLSQRLFCEQRGINLHTFVYWVGKLKQADSVSGFISVVQSSVSKPNLGFEIEYPNGVKLRISTSQSLQMIRQLIELY